MRKTCHVVRMMTRILGIVRSDLFSMLILDNLQCRVLPGGLGIRSRKYGTVHKSLKVHAVCLINQRYFS